jgi:hypothetical protein
LIATVNLIGAQIRLLRLLFVTSVGLSKSLVLSSDESAGHLLLLWTRAVAGNAIELNVGTCACPHCCERIFVLLMHVWSCLELTWLGVITRVVGAWRRFRTVTGNALDTAVNGVLRHVQVLLWHAHVSLGLVVGSLGCLDWVASAVNVLDVRTV